MTGTEAIVCACRSEEPAIDPDVCAAIEQRWIELSQTVGTHRVVRDHLVWIVRVDRGAGMYDELAVDDGSGELLRSERFR